MTVTIQSNDNAVETIPTDNTNENNQKEDDEQQSLINVTIHLSNESIEVVSLLKLPTIKEDENRPQSKPIQDLEL